MAPEEVWGLSGLGAVPWQCCTWCLCSSVHRGPSARKPAQELLGVTGTPCALLDCPAGSFSSQSCGEAGAVPQTARRSSPGANYRLPTHESNLDFRARCDTHCLGLLRSQSVPLPETQTTAMGRHVRRWSWDQPSRGVCRTCCRLPRCCHARCSPHPAPPQARNCSQLHVWTTGVHTGEQRCQEPELCGFGSVGPAIPMHTGDATADARTAASSCEALPHLGAAPC